MLLVMECHCRTLSLFFIHEQDDFENETMDKFLILYDAICASFSSPFISYVFPSAPMGLTQ